MIFTKIPVNKIRIEEKQVRKEFDDQRLKQLADSIQEVGQLQPVIVQKKDEEYLLVAGERRLRAIKKNGEESKVAAAVMGEGVDNYLKKQIQLVENLHRQDLNPLERAKAIRLFIDENNLTKKEASKKLGVPRTTLTEWLNILEVKPRYQQAVLDEDSALTVSHISLAKALVSKTGDPAKGNDLLDGVIKFNLSRREAKDILDLFYKYLHMSMEEAISTILIKREKKKLQHSDYKNDSKGEKNQIRNIINSLNKTGANLETIMEEIGSIDEDDRKKLIDEFLYVYQLLEIMIPEFKENSVNEMITRLKNNTITK